MFFRDLKLDIYPMSAIERMRHHAPPAHNPSAGFYEVEMKGERSCRISYDQAESLFRQSWHYLPVSPGHVILELKDERTGNDPFHRTAPIAWAVDEEGALRPITAGGLDDIKNWAVLSPDGLVSDLFGSSFPSEEAYLASLEDEE